ncbi:hypothetical protein V5799_017976 [Amblyomma americanum]|uniref:Uncharacterized protein n=1 Tax=Amblyomma americanum TaxID=6943 RepID=A0AAQ4F167_AMBAM
MSPSQGLLLLSCHKCLRWLDWTIVGSSREGTGAPRLVNRRGAHRPELNNGPDRPRSWFLPFTLQPIAMVRMTALVWELGRKGAKERKGNMARNALLTTVALLFLQKETVHAVAGSRCHFSDVDPDALIDNMLDKMPEEWATQPGFTKTLIPGVEIGGANVTGLRILRRYGPIHLYCEKGNRYLQVDLDLVPSGIPAKGKAVLKCSLPLTAVPFERRSSLQGVKGVFTIPPS